MENLRIVFMGTPEFAVGILDHIVIQGFKVVGVVTAADKPAGRGKQIRQSAVKEFAIKNSLPVLQPLSLKDPAFLSELADLQANVQVVVAFRMLPDVVWKMPKLGTFNLHASLLPQYRGAAPINWAIINGEKQTGVTTFFIDDKIDTGAMILSKTTEIGPHENAGELHDRLMDLGRVAVVETLEQISSGEVNRVPQPEHNNLKDAPKLNKDNTRLDWNASAKAIENQIRGLSPYPAAWCYFRDGEREWQVKILAAEIMTEDNYTKPGKISTTKKEIIVSAQDGSLKILRLQVAGKKVMTASELLNGMSFSPDAIAC